jgi:predicted DNA-binding transcriptional regulator AlpA
MFISSEIRRSQLRLLNVSEAARLLGVQVGWLHRKIRDRILPGPSVQLKRTRYYNQSGIESLGKAIAKLN